MAMSSNATKLGKRTQMDGAQVPESIEGVYGDALIQQNASR